MSNSRRVRNRLHIAPISKPYSTSNPPNRKLKKLYNRELYSSKLRFSPVLLATFIWEIPGSNVGYKRPDHKCVPRGHRTPVFLRKIHCSLFVIFNVHHSAGYFGVLFTVGRKKTRKNHRGAWPHFAQYSTGVLTFCLFWGFCKKASSQLSWLESHPSSNNFNTAIALNFLVPETE